MKFKDKIKGLFKEEIFFELKEKEGNGWPSVILPKKVFDKSQLNFNNSTRQKSSKMSISKPEGISSYKETFSLVVVNNLCLVKREVYKTKEKLPSYGFKNGKVQIWLPTPATITIKEKLIYENFNKNYCFSFNLSRLFKFKS